MASRQFQTTFERVGFARRARFPALSMNMCSSPKTDDPPPSSLAAPTTLPRLAQCGPLPRITTKSITTIKQLSAELAKIRQRGYALDEEEVIEGVMCVAVAIPRQGRTDPLLAVSVTILKPRATKALLAELAMELVEVTESVGLGLGIPVARPRRSQ